MISSVKLRKGLQTDRFGRKIYTFESIDSTNNCARALAECDAHEGTVVVAEHQSAGKGRLGRTWTSRPGENLMFSVVLRPDVEAGSVNLLSLVAAVAVAEAVEKVTGVKAECKWPNDLLSGGRKFAGILLESSLSGSELDYVVAGIGLNVNQMEFPPDIRDRATSLALLTGTTHDRTRLFHEILARLEGLYDTCHREGMSAVLPLWMQRATMFRRTITVAHNSRIVRGTMSGLSPEGGLILQTDGEEHVLFAGDVTILEIEPDASRS
jgi:BirA family biotin operon repressor/biotin-[acetyl-CoA-carboxylase] ligase